MLSRNPFARPFPERPFGRGVVIGHGRTALFVFVALLFLFSPLLALAYGVATFAVALVYHYVSEALGVRRRGPRWTLLRWTLDQAVLLFLVSVACFLLFNATRDWSLMNLRVLLYITVPTVLVGLLPIVVSGVALQLRAEGEYQKVAGRVQLSSLAGTEAPAGYVAYAVRIDPGKSAVHFSDGRAERVPLDLAGVVTRYAGQGLRRCHPDYLVNLQYIVAATADAQGLRLRLYGMETTVPVSPPYFANI
ncbi:LytTR family transcriptional regulator DNA-binding domain-containing protein [Lewinella sp. IMCC34183]|uniref:LytTR family transcriptional regulator DNA-binding domain-containing protein n=1 Tax=Lewinella sp. IMCC34183 TaxID=2248762 RepID=UPI0013005EE8|nr:LytTR family transcriptional regulator DNA-binding domain-containing protein [Lewinella sp. IMCC34183]